VLDIGLVMAALNLGGLAAPLWGALADRYRLHRFLLAGGLLVTALSLALFSSTTALVVWLALALAQGAGAAAASTVANLFIVELSPKQEWDERIGWLQTFYGGGQVAGLLIAGAMSQIDLRFGLLAAAVLAAVGILPGWLTTRTPAAPQTPRAVLMHAVRHGEWPVTSPQRTYHRPSLKAVRQLSRSLRSPFAGFLARWLVTFGGGAAIFSLYPVLMQQAYGVAPTLSSAGYAVAAGLGLALYSPAGMWSSHLGAARVLRIGYLIRLLAFLTLVGLASVPFGLRGWIALPSFVFVVLAWSLLSVSSTALAAQLAPFGEGEAMGLFNAVTALAGMLGAILGGWVAGEWGYTTVAALAAVATAAGLAPAISRLTSRSSKPIPR
jgi:hypothetical protein